MEVETKILNKHETLLLVKHYKISRLRLFPSFHVLGEKQSGYILCDIFIYDLFVKCTDKITK